MAPLPPLRDGGCALPICPFGRACLPLISDAPDCICSPGRLRLWVVWASRPGAAAPISIHALRAGGDAIASGRSCSLRAFQSTRPVWGATAGPWTCPPRSRISIHAPRAGRDLCLWTRYAGLTSFQSTRPVWGATEQEHELREKAEISIHAPRVGRDALEPDGAVTQIRFQSTRPVWGATAGCTQAAAATSNFNPRAPCGARLFVHGPAVFRQYFNPRAPCGARQAKRRRRCLCQRFQSTRPVWGATDGDVRDRLRECISIHAPRVGRDMPTA